MSTLAGLPCLTLGWTTTGGSSPRTSLISVTSCSAVRWLESGTKRSDTLTLPVGGGSVCSQTFRTTSSAPCSAASVAAHVNALRLPGDPSTPTTTVFQALTMLSSRAQLHGLWGWLDASGGIGKGRDLGEQTASRTCRP